MSAKRTLLYVLVPMVYVIIIGTFLYLHFTRTDTLVEKAGNLEVEAIRRIGLFGKELEIRKLEIRYSGMAFSFSKESPLLLETPTEPEASLGIIDYSLYPDGVEIRFASGVRLGFEIGGSLGSRLDLSLAAAATSVIHVPVSFGSGELTVGEGVPLATVRNAFGDYLISLPAGSRIDPESGEIRIAMDPTTEAVSISFERSDEPISSLHLIWYARRGDLAGREAYADGLRGYLERAYIGWDSERYVRGTGTWFEKNADPRFLEELGNAWIVEALKRGQYRKATAFFAAAQDIYLRENPDYPLRFVNSPFIGDLAAFRSAHSEESLGKVKQAEDLIRESDPRVFLINDLIVSLLDQKKTSTIDDLVSQLVVPMDLAAPSLDVALGMLETYLEVERWYPEKAGYFDRFRAVIENTILPHLKALEDGIFLADAEAVDLERSIRAGSLLQRIGQGEEDEQLAALGRSIVLSALAYADEQGFLPRTIRVAPDIRITGDASISPESIYPYLADWPYLPSEQPLYPFLDPGVWIWAAAELRGFAADDGQFRMTLDFPPGETHYIMIHGISAPSSVRFQDTALEAVEDLSIPPDGWMWSEESQSLSLKLQQESETGELVIDFRL